VVDTDQMKHVRVSDEGNSIEWTAINQSNLI